MLLKTIIGLLIVIGCDFAFAGKVCNSDVSKPCGKGCISKDLRCSKSWTTSTSRPGGRQSSKKTYDDKDIKFVNEAPNEIK